jgi:putative transposase
VVSLVRKAEAVAHLDRKLQVSQRRACKIINQLRSTQRYEAWRPARDAKLAAELRRYAVEHPRRGYRMVASQLRRHVMKANRKRVARLWRQEGLRVPLRRHKRRRLGHGGNSMQQRGVLRLASGCQLLYCRQFSAKSTDCGADGIRHGGFD